MTYQCKYCANFSCEVMMSDGEPLEPLGECDHHRKTVEADDYCNSFRSSEWAKRKEGGAG